MAQLSSSENNASKLHQNSWKKLSEKKVFLCVCGGVGSVPPGIPGIVCPGRVYCIGYIKYLVSQISKLKKKKQRKNKTER